MSNEAFSGLIATYIFINGPDSWRELGREFGANLPPPDTGVGSQLGPYDEVINGVVVGPEPKPRGGGRRKNRTKKSSRRSRHRSRRRRHH